MKKLTFLFFIALTPYFSFAQCEKCDTTVYDYCYFNAEIDGLCAGFKAESSEFTLFSGKKSKVIPVVKNDSVGYYVSLTKNKALKISALELLFIQQALTDWRSAERDLGMEFTASGLGVKIIQQGDGEQPKVGQKVKVHYKGTLEDGTVFDNSYDRGQPIDFPLGQGRVIKGWDEGIALLNVGTKALFKIPSELGYGARGAGGVIPPNATLYFEVELVGIE